MYFSYCFCLYAIFTHFIPSFLKELLILTKKKESIYISNNDKFIKIQAKKLKQADLTKLFSSFELKDKKAFLRCILSFNK